MTEVVEARAGSHRPPRPATGSGAVRARRRPDGRRPGGRRPDGRRPGRAGTAGLHLLAVLAVCFALFPIVFVVSAALNPLGTLSSTGLLPEGITLGNFAALFTRTPFGHWYLNSVVIAGVASAASTFISACAAYAFSRLRFSGRRPGLFLLLLVQMFPQFLAIVTIFLMFTTVSDYYPAVGFNSAGALILLYLGGALGANTWLTKGFFDTVPRELDEAAKLDGASHARLFFTVILPLAAPILAVTVLLSFITTINEFLIANVFLTDPGAKTLAVGLHGLIATERNQNFGLFAAGSLLTAIPTVALFFVLQRYIVSGLTSGSVRG